MTAGKLRVIIVGGAITGCTLAAALRDVASEIIVLERNPSAEAMDLEQGGAGLALLQSSNAILRSDLLLPQGIKGSDVRSARHEGEGNVMRILSWTTGQVGMSMPSPGETWTVHRKTLTKALYEVAIASKGPVTFKWGKTAARIDTTKGIVETTDGEVFEGDLIVGADGVRSCVRTAILEASGLPVASSVPLGVSCARWSLRDEEVPEKTRECLRLPSDKGQGYGNTTFHSDSHRLVTYRMRDDGLLNSIVYFYDSFVPPSLATQDRPSGTSWRQAGSTALLKKLVDESNPAEPLAQLLAVPQQVGLWQLRKYVPLPTWSHGRAVLLGDAAHPMAPFQGSGSSQAIEDVEALVHALIASQKDGQPLSKALDDFYKLRFLRASIVQAISDRTPFPQDLLEESQRQSQDKASSALNGARKHPAYRQAAERVEEAMKSHSIDLCSPTVAR